MGPQGGLTFGLSPDDTRTSIDTVMYERYSREQLPSVLSAQDAFFFKQGTTEGKTHFIYDEDSGIPNFQKTAEQEDLKQVDTRIGNKTTVASQKYTSSVPISYEAFLTDQHGKRAEIGNQQGSAARRSQDQNAILNTFGDAFAGSINTTPDAQAWASNAHTTLRGATIDNLEVAALTPDAMWTANNSLAQQKGQHGEVGGHMLRGVVVPHTLYKTLKEIMGSPLLANSGENNLNIFDSDYGNVMLRESVFLNSATNTNSNANTSYHLLGEDHFNMRKIFFGLETYIKDRKVSTNDTFVHVAEFHEVAFPGTYTAYVGSNGSA